MILTASWWSGGLADDHEFRHRFPEGRSSTPRTDGLLAKPYLCVLYSETVVKGAAAKIILEPFWQRRKPLSPLL